MQHGSGCWQSSLCAAPSKQRFSGISPLCRRFDCGSGRYASPSVGLAHFRRNSECNQVFGRKGAGRTSWGPANREPGIALHVKGQPCSNGSWRFGINGQIAYSRQLQEGRITSSNPSVHRADQRKIPSSACVDYHAKWYRNGPAKWQNRCEPDKAWDTNHTRQCKF